MLGNKDMLILQIREREWGIFLIILEMAMGWGEAYPFPHPIKILPPFSIISQNKFSGVEMMNSHVKNDFFILISFLIYLFYNKYG